MLALVEEEADFRTIYAKPQLAVRAASCVWGPAGRNVELRETGVYVWNETLSGLVLINDPNDQIWHPIGVSLLAGRPVYALPDGAFAVFGGSGRGKSLMINSLSLAWQRRVRLIGEPVPGSAQGHPAELPAAMSTELDLLDRDASAPRFVLVDSLRYYAVIGETPGKGGIPRELSSLLTALDSLGRARHAVILAAVNVMTRDPTAVSAVQELIDGSCQGVFEVTNAERLANGRVYRISGSLTCRPQPRDAVAFKLELPAPPLRRTIWDEG